MVLNLGKKLIITEKPSVARDFAQVLGVSGRQDGYLENEKYVIILTDSAGNTNSKVFTTVPPSVQLNLISSTVYDMYYEIYITIFDSSIHEVEGFRYLVFEYGASISS